MSNTKKILKKRVNDTSSQAVENTFSFRLAFALATRMMSQAELAKACDIAPSNISQYLAKNAEPRIDKLKLMAERLHVTTNWLTGEGKASDIDKRQGSDALAPDEQKLLRYYQTLDPADKDFLLKTAEVYVRISQEKKNEE